MRRAHVFACFMPPRDRTRGVRPFQLRDLAAAHEVVAALALGGYVFGETLLNHPPGAGRAVPHPLLPMAFDRVHGDDVVLTATRMPLSDHLHGDPKRVQRGWTWLEARLLERWSRYFDVLARTHVRLAPRLWPLLPDGYRDRCDIVFRSGQGAFYKRLNACDGQPARKVQWRNRTAAFLLREDALWPDGPGHIGLFGMDGTSTLVWAWQLRHVVPQLLDERGFTMVELVGDQIPERPTDLDWIARWTVEPVLVGVH